MEDCKLRAARLWRLSSCGLHLLPFRLIPRQVGILGARWGDLGGHLGGSLLNGRSLTRLNARTCTLACALMHKPSCAQSLVAVCLTLTCLHRSPFIVCVEPCGKRLVLQLVPASWWHIIQQCTLQCFMVIGAWLATVDP